MVKMIRDNTGRFAERPFYEALQGLLEVPA